MIALEYIVAFAMGMTNLFKKNINSQYVPFIAMFLAIFFNVLNALLFGADILEAGKNAFVTSGIIVGLFAGGSETRKAIEKKVK